MASNEFVAYLGTAIAVVSAMIGFMINTNSKITKNTTKIEDVSEDVKDIKNTVNTFATLMIDVSKDIGAIESSSKSAHKRIDKYDKIISGHEKIIKCHDDLIKEQGSQIEHIKKTIKGKKPD
jgi:outer membrane murein-binding lipoprotein Lpp